MKKIFYIFGILVVGLIGSLFTWYFGCCDCDQSKCNVKIKKTVSIIAKSPTSYPLQLKDTSGTIKYSSQSNFNFYENKDQIILPLGNEVSKIVGHVKKYIHGYRKREIDVIGLYKSTENNTTAFPDLGIARANAIKNYLVANGVDSQNVNLKSKLDNSLIVTKNRICKGPILLNAIALTDDEFLKEQDELKNIYDHIVTEPLILHFDFGSNKLKFTETQRFKIQEIITYLGKNHQSMMGVIGHTDNVGDVNTNVKLGLDRANFIKKYLIDLGVFEEQIKTMSKGPRNPITTNETPEGRANNRRVEIILE